jgi:deazaflavin-dependent oxidoreductase (nitroreductase family)
MPVPTAYIPRVNLKNKSVFVGDLTTIGRRTGLPRTVELRMVFLDGKFYAASRKIESKHWCRNMIKNPDVEVKADGEVFSCRAQQVANQKLRVRVLDLRDSPPLLERVVFEMIPRNVATGDPAESD